MFHLDRNNDPSNKKMLSNATQSLPINHSKDLTKQSNNKDHGDISREIAQNGFKKDRPTHSKNESIQVGVLLASHGDIDSMAEVEDYIKTSYKKNDAVPFPAWLRDATKQPAFVLSRQIVRSQYRQIGSTHYRENTQKQVKALSKALEKKEIPARAYAGFNFTGPFLEDTLAQMQKDGIGKIVLINQGAQYSEATGGENIKDVKNYLKKHPEWNVEVRVIKEFSSDPRFRELFAKAIESDIKRLFPKDKPEDVAVLMGSHGMPISLIEKGDPAVPQMQQLVKDLRMRLKNYKLYHGYLNDDFIPGAKWIGPEVAEVAEEMHHKGHRKVMLDGRMSFTVHHRATLYDLNVLARQKLTQKTVEPKGANSKEYPTSKVSEVEVKLAPNFDGDPDFADYLSQISLEALEGKGDIAILRNSELQTQRLQKVQDKWQRSKPSKGKEMAS